VLSAAAGIEADFDCDFEEDVEGTGIETDAGTRGVGMEVEEGTGGAGGTTMGGPAWVLGLGFGGAEGLETLTAPLTAEFCAGRSPPLI